MLMSLIGYYHLFYLLAAPRSYTLPSSVTASRFYPYTRASHEMTDALSKHHPSFTYAVHLSKHL